MKSAAAAFVLAMVVTALCTPVVRRAALAKGAVDEPGARRVHTRRVPRLGGIAIVVGFFLPLLILLAGHTHAAMIFFSARRVTASLVVGALLIVSAGLLDDLKGMGAKSKLLVQTLAAAVAYVGGMRIEGIDLPYIGSLHLGWFALPATVAWIVGIVNAINLIDGLDGLAAGISFFACLTNFVIALLTGNLFIMLITASLGGAVVGFLFYNFNPAQIFMGDSGSMFLGFILGCASLLGAGTGTQKSPTLIAIIVPILALGLPILDMLMTIARRFLERRSIFIADRGHIHHRLLDMGLTHRRSVLSLYMLSITFTIVAFITYFGRSWQVGAALFALTAVLVVVVRFVGYFNTVVGAGHSEHTEPLRRSVPRALQRLAEASSPDQLPIILADFGADSGLLAIRIVNPKSERLQRWGWEAPWTHERPRSEAACVGFDVSDDREAIELQFYLDPAKGSLGPEVRILLQLVADSAEALFARQREPRTSMVDGGERIALGGE